METNKPIEVVFTAPWYVEDPFEAYDNDGDDITDFPDTKKRLNYGKF